MIETKKKVLIVDDEPNIVRAISFLLEDSGVEILTAFEGESGYKLAVQHAPDVLVLDVMMPGLDGYSVAKKIRQHPELDKVNIVFLTAKGTSSDKMTGYDSGAELYIVKPFDNDELIEKITSLMV